MAIRITPDEMKQSAQQFTTQQQQAEQMMTQLTSEIQKLESTWEGTASARFKEAWPEYQTSMKNMTEMLGQISQQLTQTADRMQQADEESASGIGGQR